MRVFEYLFNSLIINFYYQGIELFHFSFLILHSSFLGYQLHIISHRLLCHSLVRQQFYSTAMLLSVTLFSFFAQNVPTEHNATPLFFLPTRCPYGTCYLTLYILNPLPLLHFTFYILHFTFHTSSPLFKLNSSIGFSTTLFLNAN